MFPCVHTIELNRYLGEIDRADALDMAIEARIKESMEEGGEFDPLEPKNFSEGLGEVTDYELAVIAGLIRTEHYEQASRLMEASIKTYWLKVASRKAEEYVEKSCFRCFGRGCQYCEEP